MPAEPGARLSTSVSGAVVDPIVRCDHLVRFFTTPTARVQAVRGVDLEIEPGTTAAIVGPSGSGKSSLLRMLSGLDRPTAGVVVVDGVDLYRLSDRARARARSRLLTHVYQRPEDNLVYHLTAEQQLRRIARPDHGARSVDDALAMFGLDHRRRAFPVELSGGEQQRLAFARAIVSGHGVIVADEPTSELDSDNTDVVLEAMEILAAQGVTLVVATHDQRVIDRLAQVITLRDGAVATVTRQGTELSVIDRSGRVQLPPEVRDRFAERRARLRYDTATGRVELEQP